MPFFCNICEQESTKLCVNCTKDTCGNHLCEKCARCSDCCSCDLALEPPDLHRHPMVRPVTVADDIDPNGDEGKTEEAAVSPV